jgi:hypothetical protein
MVAVGAGFVFVTTIVEVNVGTGSIVAVSVGVDKGSNVGVSVAASVGVFVAVNVFVGVKVNVEVGGLFGPIAVFVGVAEGRSVMVGVGL